MDDRGHLHRVMDDETMDEAKRRLGRDLFPVAEEDVEELRERSPAERKNWMRNKPCPCGSGRKFKKCHWYQCAGFERKAQAEEKRQRRMERDRELATSDT